MITRELTTVYIISPHQDDAAFSLTLTMAKLAETGCVITIVNCFTVSAYTVIGPPLSVTDASVLRHEEDLRFIANLPGVLLNDLGFEDAPLRLGVSPECVCDSLALRLDPAAGKLRRSFLDLPFAELVFVPLAVGAHVDHLLARDEALAAFQAKQIVFYQDLPYARRFADLDLEIASILSGLNLPSKPFKFSINASFNEKFKCISTYNSQAQEDELWAMADYPGGERVWLTEQASAYLLTLNHNVELSS